MSFRSVLERLSVQTGGHTELIDVTERVEAVVRGSGVAEGRVFVNTLHTTTAVAVNEGLEDLEDDLLALLGVLVPAEGTYRHARFLHSDGQMAVNAPSHLKGAVLGMHVSFPVANGVMVRGARQTIYFVELDGPLRREFSVQVVGV